jgi:phage gp29-like protein
MTTMPTKPAGAMLYQPYATETVVSVLSRLPDPDLVLSNLGLGRHELRKLETDDEIAAALETRREAVIATPWRLDPYEGEAAEWLWAELEPHIEPLLRGAWSAVPYGFSVVEAVYRKPRPGSPRVGIDFVQEKPIEWFEPKRDGALLYSPPNGGSPHLVDTSAKFLLTRRNPTYRNPFGEALLSRAYWPWFFRHNGWRFWMAFLERFSDPLLMGRVFQPSEFVAAMQQLGLSAVIGVGKDESVEAVTQSAAGEFERVERALVQRIQKLILGQTLTSQVDGQGSYAAAKVHNEVRDDKRRADIRLVTAIVQRLVEALWALNALPGDPPSFVLQDDTGLEMERAERDAKLATAGILKFTDAYIVDKYDLEQDEFVIPTTPTPPETGSASTFAARRTLVQLAAPNDDPDTVDLQTERLSREAAPMVEGLLTQIRRELEQADSLRAFEARLLDLYPELDGADLTELLARAFAAGELAGLYEAR